MSKSPLAQPVYGGSVPTDVQNLWSFAETHYMGVPAQRPGSTWTQTEAQSAATLTRLYYDQFLKAIKAPTTMLLPDGSAIEEGDAYWACDTRLCESGCTNMASICRPDARAQVVGGLVQWLGHNSGNKQLMQAVIGTDTTMIGDILDAETSDAVRQAVAGQAGSIPVERMLLNVYGKPGEYASWTVNGLLRILGGWPASGSVGFQGEAPSFQTIMNAIDSLRRMVTPAMPVNIRIQIAKYISDTMQGNRYKADGTLVQGKDIRLPGDRPGPWSSAERGKLFEQASQLAADATSPKLNPPTSVPDTIPNPWRPSSKDIPTEAWPPKTGVFGKHTNLVFGIGAGLLAFLGAGALITVYKRRYKQNAPLALQPLGRAHFPSAAKVRQYIRRR
jgi:hypothetical protein